MLFSPRVGGDIGHMLCGCLMSIKQVLVRPLFKSMELCQQINSGCMVCVGKGAAIYTHVLLSLLSHTIDSRYYAIHFISGA